MTNIARWTARLLMVAIAALPAAAATLYATTGKGAATPHTLFTLSQRDAWSTFVLVLGAGNLDCDAIAYNPMDKLMYHWARTKRPNVMQSINLATSKITSIPQSGDTHKQIVGATWQQSNSRFLLIANTAHLIGATPRAAIKLIGGIPDVHVIRGLAFAGGTLYGVSQDHPELYELDPATPAVLTTQTVSGLDGLSGFNGLATDPDTGILWTIARVGASTSANPGVRHLGTLNPKTAVFTSVGILSDAFASLAFVGTSGPSTLDRPFKVLYASTLTPGAIRPRGRRQSPVPRR